ncbi:SDR family NAD(P)-dependent oxidoreductase [Actinacidiphila acidipaludis]|uniref:SDR family oxidoreductase n=1 Tax=Actinacidiphila acidipaludis TaxID=2873382 RepID=A0ABS7PZ75_9ACTN|nr:SDR family oxidoreductase [Streptomyces acidipaludis]MBY8876163.1 SDR family oxidoreductase [Streptomyces acidipaludis]
MTQRTGTTVAVTGGAAGLGYAIAEELVGRGRTVVLLDRDEAALDAAVTSLGAGRVEGAGADLSTVEGVRAAAEVLLARGDVAALVNNAGGWLPGEQYPEAGPDRWLAALTLNLTAPMLLTQLLWPTLAAVSGAVVNIGSSGGLGDTAYGSPEYGAAKAGLRRFTTSLAGRRDVRVMAVVPGWIGLDRGRRQWAALSPHDRAEAGPLVPPEQIASTVRRLLESGRAGEVVHMLRGDQL